MCEHKEVSREVVKYIDEVYKKVDGKYVLFRDSLNNYHEKDFMCHDCNEWFSAEELGFKE